MADPDSYDVIVIGVGGMGGSACYHLARRGARVLGLEQFALGHDRGSSHGETRMIRRAYFEHPDYVPLLNRAYELWEELERETGQSLFVRNGVVIYGDASGSAVYRGVISSAEMHRIPIEKLSRAEALVRFPAYVPPEGVSSVFEPDAGFLHVERVVRAHASAARARGAVLHEQEAVLGYEREGGAYRVRTSKGVYSARKLVVTAGPWSAGVLRKLGLPLELHRKVQFWFRASPEHALGRGVPCFAFHLGQSFFYGFPMLDGRTVKVASHFSKHPIREPAEAQAMQGPEADLAPIQEFIRSCLPGVSTEVVRRSPCIYTMTPDEHFVIDLHPENPGLALAGGFSGHGFKFASVVGEILAELALDGQSRHPIGFLSLDRFGLESRRG